MEHPGVNIKKTFFVTDAAQNKLEWLSLTGPNVVNQQPYSQHIILFITYQSA
jgi:hypothetical protein